MARPRIAVLLGDPAGVGPEMGVKLLARAANRDAAKLLLIAPAAALAAGEAVAEVSLPVRRAESTEQIDFAPGCITHLVQPDTGDVRVGECSAAGGQAVLQALETATDLAQAGHIDGILFAPMNKHALHLAGMHEEDELRFLQRRFGVQAFVCEFNITGRLWTSRVTSHVPLRDVAALITPQAVESAVKILHEALVRAGVRKPRIAVTGLNPHAGDNGSIGSEELEVIAPVVKWLQTQGLTVTGPWSPDTVFIAARDGKFDAVVSMYHDQGQIAMKLMGFEMGVTLHGGLPVPVATSASGSAFDIAGRNVARVDGLQQAFDLCVRVAR